MRRLLRTLAAALALALGAQRDAVLEWARGVVDAAAAGFEVLDTGSLGAGPHAGRRRPGLAELVDRARAGGLELADHDTAADVARAVLAEGDVTPLLDTDTKAWLERAKPRLFRASIAYFMRYALGMQVGPHHVEWSEIIGARLEKKERAYRKLAFLAARGHGKSAFWSFAYPAWRSWRDPDTTGLLISKTDAQASDLMRVIKDGKAFEDEDGQRWSMPSAAMVAELRDIVPSTWEKQWTTERIWFTNGSNFRAKTFGKSFRGAHVGWIVVDDPLGDDAQYSQRARDKARDFLYRAIAPMLLPAAGSQLAVVGTPLHGADLHTDLAQNAEYHHARYPGHWIDPETGEDRFLWPALKDAAWHASEQATNALAYQQEIELRPASDVNSLFPPELFERHPTTKDATFVLGQYTAEDCAELGWTVVFGVDFAISAEVGADYTVITVVAVDAFGFRRLIDWQRVRGAPHYQQIGMIRTLAARHQPAVIKVETNGFQVIFAQDLELRSDLPISRSPTGTEKHNLRVGVPGLRPGFEAGKWRFPYGDAASREATDLILSELAEIRIINGAVVSTGQHDDTVMSLWLADKACRTGAGWGYSILGDDADPYAAEREAEAAEAELNGEDARRARAEADAATAAAARGAPTAAESLAALVETERREARAAMAANRTPPAEDPFDLAGLPRRPAGPTVNAGAVRWSQALEHATESEIAEACSYVSADAAGFVAAWNAFSRVGGGMDVAAAAKVLPTEVVGALRVVSVEALRAMIMDLLGLG